MATSGLRTKMLGIAIADYDAQRISRDHLLSIFQESIDNGDILEENNEFYVVAHVIPLVDAGLLKPSEYLRQFAIIAAQRRAAGLRMEISTGALRDSNIGSNVTLADPNLPPGGSHGGFEMTIHVKPKDGPVIILSIEEINARLARGEFAGSEPSWLPGMSEWTPLRNIQGLSLPTPPPLPSEQGEYISVENRGPESGGNSEVKKESAGKRNHHPWRRFFARTIDVSTLGLLLFFIIAFAIGVIAPGYAEQFSGAIENQVVAGILVYVLWVPVEAWCLSAFASTPAKWLFGIRVVDSSGKSLSFWRAQRRALLVWLQGEGLGIPLVTLFTRIFAYNRLTKTGSTLWDDDVGSVVTHTNWGAFRQLTCSLVVLATLLWIVFLSSL